MKKVYRSSEVKKDACHLIYPSHLKYEESRKMPYLALLDQLNRFIRKKSSFLILCGYSFNDGHLNDTIINALKSNPTAMVLGLMFEKYEYQNSDGVSLERYPEANRLAKKQHNLNIWNFDKAIIGTNLGLWRRIQSNKEEVDPDLKLFVSQENAPGEVPSVKDLVALGDFAVFTQFLKKIIGSSKAILHVK